MITDERLAELAQLAYTAPPTWSQADVHCCATDAADAAGAITILSFRGTTDDPRDWLRDVLARHQVLTMHQGGYEPGLINSYLA